MSEKCHCKRCGNEWYALTPWSYETGYKKEHVPKRCAKCRSPYWNRDYVRKIQAANRNPNGDYHKQDLPLLHVNLDASHDAGIVSSKVMGDKRNAALKRRLSAFAPRMMISRSVKTRAARVVSKRVNNKKVRKQNAKNASAGRV
jgi:hypothetical protein